MKKYDLHIHTYCSKCGVNDPAKILKRAKELGLDGIAVTDHNEIRGAIEVAELNDDPDFEVIIGEEVMTDRGEMLVYYVKDKIEPGKYEDVIREVRRQMALCSIAHPFTGGNRAHADVDFFEKLPRELLPDAIETFNGRVTSAKMNQDAKAFAEKLGLAETGGSDGHFLFGVGCGHTSFDGNLREALKEKTTKTGGKLSLQLFKTVFSGFVKMFKRK